MGSLFITPQMSRAESVVTIWWLETLIQQKVKMYPKNYDTGDDAMAPDNRMNIVLARNPRKSAERFVEEYQMLHLGLKGSDVETSGMCASCEFCVSGEGEVYGDDDGANDDWCRLYAGAFMDGQEHRCPAWLSLSNTEDVDASRPKHQPTK